MPNTDTTHKQVWKGKLTGNSVDDKVDALRQISWEEGVTGLTVAVVRLAEDRDEEVRMWSAEALESSVQPDPSEVGALVDVLTTAFDREVGYWAATMLGRLGKSAAPAAGALEAGLRDSTYLPTRERAAWALGQIGPPASSAMAALERAAETAPPRLRRLATEAIRMILGPEAVARNEGSEEDIAA